MTALNSSLVLNSFLQFWNRFILRIKIIKEIEIVCFVINVSSEGVG